MPIRADYHLHSSFSGDSDAAMEDMVVRATALDLTEICFTEHMDFDYPVTLDTPAGFFEVDTLSYRRKLDSLRRKYAGQVKVRFGIELGMQPHLHAQNAAYVAKHDFDFVIASTHIAGRMDPYLPAFFAGRSQEEAYRAYFGEALACMQSFSDFDVYGHIDYVIRYGPRRDDNYTYDQYRDLFEKMIHTILSKGKGIELNTGGLRRGLRQAHPCTAFLKRYRKLGGEIITVGSDAHTPPDMASDFAKASELLKDCGFLRYCTFEKRTPIFHAI